MAVTLTTKFTGTIPARTEVSGISLAVYLAGFGTFAEMGKKIMREEGLDPDGPAPEWLPVPAFVAGLQKVRQKIGAAAMRQIGAKVPEGFPMPPEVLASAHLTLGGLDRAYQGAHRNGDIGCFAYDKTGERSGDIVAQNPYPCAFDEGLITGFVRRAEKLAAIKHDPATCRERGDLRCVYHIHW